MKTNFVARIFIFVGLLASLGLFAITAATAADRTETVRFPAGSTGTQLQGSFSGRDTVLYKVSATADQFMTVSLSSDNTSTYFNVYAPGKGLGDEALAVGSRTDEYMVDLNSFRGNLPQTGEYTIAVYLYRNAARRGDTSNYRLNIDISSQGGDYADGLTGGPDYWQVTDVPAGDTLNVRASPSTSADILVRVANGTPLRNLGCSMQGSQRWCQVETVEGADHRGWVAGRYLMESSYQPSNSGGAVNSGTGNSAERAGLGEFDANGSIPCAWQAGQPTTQCEFGVARAGNGNATVVINLGDGRTRAIFFVNGDAVGADTSQADGYGEFSVERSGDLYLIRVGDERYEIFEAVVYGG